MNTAHADLSRMKEEHWQLLRPLFMEGCCALLKHYGVAAQGRTDYDGNSEEPHVAGVLGFSGERIRGAVSVYVPQPFFQRESLNLQLGATCEQDGEMLADWVGEFCNQILGRVKVRLCEGAQFQLSTPVTFAGKQLRSLLRAQAQPCRIVLVCEEHEILLECDGEIDPSIDPSSLLTDEEPILAEGEMMFF